MYTLYIHKICHTVWSDSLAFVLIWFQLMRAWQNFHFYGNMLFSNSSEEHCIIQMFSFQAKIQNVCLSNIKHDSQSKHHSMKHKRTKKQQTRSENCVTTTYLCHIFPQFCFQALHICFLLLFFFQNPLET